MIKIVLNIFIALFILCFVVFIKLNPTVESYFNAAITTTFGSNIIFVSPNINANLPTRSCIYYEKIKILKSKFDFHKCNFGIKSSKREINANSILNKLQTKYII